MRQVALGQALGKCNALLGSHGAQKARDVDGIVELRFRVTATLVVHQDVRMGAAARWKDEVGQISSLRIINATGSGRGVARACYALCPSQLTGSDAANHLDGETTHT